MALSKFRMALNAVGTFAIAAFCLVVGMPGVFALLSGQYGTDPDGADKVTGILSITAVIGVIALVSFIRTLLAWRRSTG